MDKRKAADLAEVTLVAAEREKRRADQANAIGVIPVIDFEKAQDDLRNAEVAHEHAVMDAKLFEERLQFELRASELALERQALLVRDLERQVDELALRSPVSALWVICWSNRRAAVSRDTPVMAVVRPVEF